MSSFQSRKFLLSLLILALGGFFNWFNHLTPEIVDLMKWVVGLYLGFNVTQKGVAAVTTKPTPEPTVPQ